MNHLETLNQHELAEVEGGSAILTGFIVAGSLIAAFSVGYKMGKECGCGTEDDSESK